MLKISGLLIITGILGAAGQYAQAAGIETGLPSMLAQVRPAVVSIRAVVSEITTSDALDDPNIRKALGIPQDVLIVQSGVIATGSGVIVDRNGYIVTNSHLIANADDISVTLADGKVYQAGRVGVDAPTDLAVVKIDAPGLPALNWGRSSELRVGDFVVAIGNPFDLAQTATFGIVSGLGRSGLGVDEYEDYIQTDAAINPGSSGGALVTPSGSLIGITRGVPATSEASASAGIGFAIPSQIAEQIVRQMIAHGEYRRGWLGLSVTDTETDGGGNREEQGMAVNSLTCNSAAERQGVQLGDVIMALNGRTLGTVTAFTNAVSLLPANSRITLDIRRGEKLQRLELVLSDRNDDPRHNTSSVFLDSVTIGFPSRAYSKACAPTGPVLLDVGIASVAYSAGLRAGDFLTSINGQALNSLDQVAKILEEPDGKASVDIL
ncbi:MAG: trypsin-like peptidase domain-containing protein, partial [Pararhizobium sp.]